jgi:RNA polymerase primary sigma factor
MQNTESLHIYFKDINKFPLLTKEQEEGLILRAQFGEEAAKDLLVLSNLRFVVTIAKKFVIPQVELEDLIQEGNMGLIKSIEKFNPNKNVKFLSYAVWWIKQAIYAYINEHSRTVRLSLNQIRDNNEYRKLKEEIVSQTSNEYAEPAGHSINEVSNLSLDEPIGDMNVLEVIPNNDVENPDRGLIAESLKSEITQMFSTLNDRESEILKLYYGIGIERALTLDEIGDRLGLTRERVRQIKEITLNRISLKPKYKALINYL